MEGKEAPNSAVEFPQSQDMDNNVGNELNGPSVLQIANEVEENMADPSAFVDNTTETSSLPSCENTLAPPAEILTHRSEESDDSQGSRTSKKSSKHDPATFLKNAMAKAIEEEVCQVCFIGDADEDNEILICSGCNVFVHQVRLRLLKVIYCFVDRDVLEFRLFQRMIIIATSVLILESIQKKPRALNFSVFYVLLRLGL